MKAKADVQKNDYRFMLTNLLSRFTVDDVARFKDIVAGVAQQTARKREEMTRDLEELNNLRAAYQRYRELDAQMGEKERRLKIGFALLFNVPVKVNPEADAYVPAPEEIDMQYEQVGIAMNWPADLNLSEFPLWQVIREIVRQVPEMRVYELEAHLGTFGLKVTRPAIESALATHPKEFKVTKRGREKFVSLKGA